MVTAGFDSTVRVAAAALVRRSPATLAGIRTLLLTLGLLICSSTATAQLVGKVVGVHDGDTLTLRTAADTIKVRLAGIDAPELGQPFGKNAKQALSALVFGKMVIVVAQGEDRYDRTLGDVVIAGGRVTVALVAGGMAWQYRQYDKSPELAAAEAEARAARRGLWADPNPIPPWEWRRQGR